jgi:hypothetical protein
LPLVGYLLDLRDDFLKKLDVVVAAVRPAAAGWKSAMS